MMPRVTPITIELDAKAIGKRIAKARRARKWRQRDLARVVGVSKSAVACWECGSRIPPRDMIVALSIGLRRTLRWLLLGQRGRVR
ncbi:MAG: helix-turn-helix domain-containing protein [Planctomycetes bacterium]|nr:helix-turn-helix domain-containing protein [Planctomycetota bacterium]